MICSENEASLVVAKEVPEELLCPLDDVVYNLDIAHVLLRRSLA